MFVFFATSDFSVVKIELFRLQVNTLATKQSVGVFYFYDRKIAGKDRT